MWLPTCPEKSAALRQGDFLCGLVLPRLTWPLSYARPPESTIDKNQMVLLPAAKPYGYLVVSQCCTIENQTVAALAEVRSTKPLSESELRGFEREQPVYEREDSTPADAGVLEDTDSGYVFNAHALAPFGDYLRRNGGRIYVADFITIQTYSGRHSRFSRSPCGRDESGWPTFASCPTRALWGRAEDEDEKWLIEHDVPVGETSPE